MRDAEPVNQEEYDGIYRFRELAELPRGIIADVEIGRRGRGHISRVGFRFRGGEQMALMAGEVYEQADGSLRCVRDDESVLVFKCAADEDAIWGYGRS